MAPGSRRTLNRWLDAERQREEGAAERALAEVFRSLGKPRPTAGFAARTLERAGFVAPARQLLPSWLLRACLATALTLTALSSALVQPSLTTLVGGSNRALGAGIGFLATVCERLAHGLATWGVLARISRSIVETLADPTLIAALGLSLLMSLLAFSWLSQLLALERSAEHV